MSCSTVVVFLPLYDKLGECIVEDHGGHGRPPQGYHVRARAEDGLGEAGDELAERLAHEGEYFHARRTQEILAVHSVQYCLQ